MRAHTHGAVRQQILTLARQEPAPTIGDVIDELGCSPSYVWEVLRYEGIRLRKRTPLANSLSRTQQARELMDGKLTAAQIAARTGVAVTHVYQIASRENRPIKRLRPRKRG